MKVAKWNEVTQTPDDIREFGSLKAGNGAYFKDWSSYVDRGYYEYRPVILADGEGLDNPTYSIDGGVILQGGTVISAAEMQARVDAKYAAYIADIAPAAKLYASTLRLYFPDLDPPAEQNRAVTEHAVMGTFVAKRQAGTITAAENADSLYLLTMFQQLKGEAGNTWELPWDDIWSFGA